MQNLKLQVTQLNMFVDGLTEESESEKPNKRLIMIWARHLRDRAEKLNQQLIEELGDKAFEEPIKKVLTGKIISLKPVKEEVSA